MSQVADLVAVIARRLVDRPDDVHVHEVERRQGVRLELETAEGDLGKLIGRQGRTAAAIRTLANIVAEREGVHATVDFVDARD